MDLGITPTPVPAVADTADGPRDARVHGSRFSAAGEDVDTMPQEKKSASK